MIPAVVTHYRPGAARGALERGWGVLWDHHPHLFCHLLFCLSVFLFPYRSLFISLSRAARLPLFLSSLHIALLHAPSLSKSLSTPSLPPHFLHTLSYLTSEAALPFPAPYVHCDSPYLLGVCIHLCGRCLIQVLGKVETATSLPRSLGPAVCYC